MSQLDEIDAWLQQRLPELLAEHQVPAAAVAVLAGDRVIEAASGVLSRATGVEATVDSVFQVGSITKVWTATLVLQLADEGALDLDQPVRSYVPQFRIGDESAASEITVRQLLCHVSGFEGDIFTDTGSGEDAVEKYLSVLTDVPQLFAPGEMFSYNNAGYCVLGRLVEVLRGKPFDTCLRDHLFTPLQLSHAANGPGEAIMYRAAVGHLQPDPEQEPVPAPMWSLARSNAPAGSRLAMSPRDLLAFARMHLSGGVGPDGAQVLSPSGVKAMQDRQVELPDLGMMGNAWGLGWEIFDLDGGTVVGHDGGTVGQSAFLRMVPGRDVAVAVLTNGGNPFPLYTEIVGRVLEDLAGLSLAPMPEPPAQREPVDAARYVGTYSSAVADTVVSQDEDGSVWIEQTPKGLFAELSGEPERKELVAWRGDTLLPAEPERGLYIPHAFVGDDGSGRALFLHTGRADRRAG